MVELSTIKQEARQAVEDLSQGGMLGLVALTTAAAAYERIRNLSAETLEADRAALLEAQRELESLERLVDSHKGALSQAFSRLVTVVGAASAALEEEA
ncbi:MAG: hypothetical protein JKY65_09755 [Planctomycetes bacterium]|nr:hypothetical protein [Planctomycetota bacterium]